MQFYLVHVDSDAGEVLADDRTSLEFMDIKSFGAEALEIHIIEDRSSLEKPSEYSVLVMHQYLVHDDSDAGRSLAGNRTSLEHLEIKCFGAEALENHIVENCESLEKPSENYFFSCKCNFI